MMQNVGDAVRPESVVKGNRGEAVENACDVENCPFGSVLGVDAD